MQNFLIALVIVVLAGGGYYLYSQRSGPVESAPSADFDSFIEDSGQSGDTMDHGPMDTGAPAPTTGAPAGGAGSSGGGASTPSAPTAAVKEITITNSGFNYSPKTITVQRGDRVKITYRNGGGTHDVRIDGYNVGTRVISGGQSETFEFVADRAGTFEFYCSVGNHRAMGMTGSFIVQ